MATIPIPVFNLHGKCDGAAEALASLCRAIPDDRFAHLDFRETSISDLPQEETTTTTTTAATTTTTTATANNNNSSSNTTAATSSSVSAVSGSLSSSSSRSSASIASRSVAVLVYPRSTKWCNELRVDPRYLAIEQRFKSEQLIVILVIASTLVDKVMWDPVFDFRSFRAVLPMLMGGKHIVSPAFPIRSEKTFAYNLNKAKKAFISIDKLSGKPGDDNDAAQLHGSSYNNNDESCHIL